MTDWLKVYCNYVQLWKGDENAAREIVEAMLMEEAGMPELAAKKFLNDRIQSMNKPRQKACKAAGNNQ